MYANFGVVETAREDVGRAMRALFCELGDRARQTLDDSFVDSEGQDLFARHAPDSVLNRLLTLWSKADGRPLVLLIDEIDALLGDSLVSVLRQLRAGYDQRPGGFPQCVVLCGVHDVFDYRVFSGSNGFGVSGGSPFNIKAESLRLGDFTRGEVRTLLGQHTVETGQEFAPGVLGRIWELTQGQRWLVNALARQVCFKDKVGRDRSRPIGLAAIDQAKETLILNRVTHLDQLANQLREERVRRVILPMIAGAVGPTDFQRDLEYVRDLGLVAASGPVRMANPIYAEVIPRELTLTQSIELEGPISPTGYVRDDGSLDLSKLLEGVQGYFREHSESWLERYGHRESGPHLVLHAYLHRLIHGGGRMTREHALARKRADLLVEWPRPGGSLPPTPSKRVIWVKVVGERSSLESVIRIGMRQTAPYMDLSGAESGHLVVFDMRPKKTWKERIFRKAPEPGHTRITVWGM